MKNLTLILIVGMALLLPKFPLTQTISKKEIVIKGKLLEKETNNPIPFAHVFIEGTLIGTTSDENGYFNLKMEEISSKPLIASAIGYVNLSFLGYNSDREIILYLKNKMYLLDDIERKADNLSFKRKMRMFESYFLGISDNAANSEITNPKDIELFYDKKTKTLHASSSEPIIINNHSLGYRIIYYLKEFSASQYDIQYTGNYFFEELQNNQESVKKNIASRRRSTYKGSKMHLIRSIWDNKLKKEGFTLFYNNYKKVKLDDVSSILPTGEKIICFKQDIIINYGTSGYNEVNLGDYNPDVLSYLAQAGGCTKIGEDGYYDPKSVRWSGKISERRIADLLPYEYYPTKK